MQTRAFEAFMQTCPSLGRRRLEAKDWVRRAPDPDNGRYTLATLTPQGHLKVDQAATGHVDLVNRLIFDPLTQTQTKQFRDNSRRIKAAIGADDGLRPSSGADSHGGH